MDSRPLPAHANLDYYKKQAKDLLKVCKAHDPGQTRAWTQHWMNEWKESWIQTMSQLSGRSNRKWLEAEFESRVEQVVKHVSAKLVREGVKLADAQFFL